ncbi:MAG: hypothetical protein KatS3mg108_2856 [Isosphaeraceae bacterium]|nr:MAG: hypothetical protein KatS3mg108_2856 [Isosphaeraceae bacterium]
MNLPDSSPPPTWIDRMRWSDDGLIPAIVQDASTGSVLMLAWMNREALIRSLQTGQTHFYSRSRRALWHKGATSGHTQHIEQIRVDCDADTLLIQVRQHGGACHEGYLSCFFRLAVGDQWISDQSPVFDPDRVYTQAELSRSTAPTDPTTPDTPAPSAQAERRPAASAAPPPADTV